MTLPPRILDQLCERLDGSRTDRVIFAESHEPDGCWAACVHGDVLRVGVSQRGAPMPVDVVDELGAVQAARLARAIAARVYRVRWTERARVALRTPGAVMLPGGEA